MTPVFSNRSGRRCFELLPQSGGPVVFHSLIACSLFALVAGGCGESSEAEKPSQSGTGVSSNKKPARGAPRFDYLSSDKTDAERGRATAKTRAEVGQVRLKDVASGLGLNHEYQNGAAGRVLMVESIGGGCAWLDYDRDGQLDACFVQGGNPVAETPDDRPSDRLFQQVAGRFVPVDTGIGIDDRLYGQGVSVGDFDNDGFDDVYITNVGRNSLWHNMGDGSFEEVTDFAGVGDPRWSSGAAWADLDLDGDLDLYVCNYLQYDPYDPLECLKDGRPALCHPRQLPAWPDECYRNRGDGTFESVADEWGLSGPGNKALGVAVVDLNQDGWPDIYVANDTTANFLFLNQQGKKFKDSALRLGCALNGDGAAQASMGVAIGDFDGNGLPDVFLTHFTGESNTLYENLGEYGFHDATNLTGIRTASWTRLGFGTVMQDLDFDGHQELFTANGHIDESNADGDGYRQKAQLLRFNGKRWEEISSLAGDYFSELLVGRGVSLGDFNADGRPDLLVVHQNSPAALLRNESQAGHWLKLSFVGRVSNRRGIGCLVEVQMGERRISAQLAGGTSFASSHEPALFVGLGDWNSPVDLRVVWPGGCEQILKDVPVDQDLRITEPDDGTRLSLKAR